MDIASRLRDLARNLWWTWHPDAIAVFRDLDPELWRKVNHNPVAFLKAAELDQLKFRAEEIATMPHINYAFHRLQEYLDHGPSWSGVDTSPLRATPIAYFSAEFGLHESIPIYSGGLGLLAGDFLKSASDLGVPMVGVGLLYAQGYFNQRLDTDGWQQESYFNTTIAELPLDRVLEEDGRPKLVRVQTRSREIAAAVWRARVGRSMLLLLDSDVEGNAPDDRQLTARLYGGDSTVRIRQELILGVGGVRALHALGIRPGALHLNEGHSAFAVLELARREMESDGISFADALGRIAGKTVFTTHTPVEAGHDRFPRDLVEETLGPLRDELGMAEEELLGLGRVDPRSEGETFCMTVLGLKGSWKTNGVSALHGKTSRRMWRSLWPDRREAEVPIRHVTNGVHVPSWIAPSLHSFYDSALGPSWEQRMSDPATWAPIAGVNDVELWDARQSAKAQLIRYVQRQVCAQEARREGKQEVCDVTNRRLSPDILTIGIARRFATYKRSDLVLSDDRRLDRIISSERRPFQIILAGKAHPLDEAGKRLIQRIYRMTRDPRFVGVVTFLEDYDINVARHMVQGVDLWLNTPRRPLEACGTSGMKALFNGVLNCSILDGWWAEAYNGENGFAIGTGTQHREGDVQDRRDAAAAYDVLENEVIPLYYDRDEHGVPRGWVARIKNALLSLAWRFNAHRMLMEYATDCYLPIVGGQPGTQA